MKGGWRSEHRRCETFQWTGRVAARPFFFPPLFSLPFHRRVRASFFLFFLPFSFLFIFFNFFPFLSFYSRKGDEGGRGCALSTCMLPLLVQSAIRVYATGTIDFVASPSWRRASSLGTFPRFRIPAIPSSDFGRTKISRVGVNGFNLELATVSFQIFKDL